MALAQSEAEYFKLALDPSYPYIRDKESWAQARAKRDGVLARLSDEALDEFEESVIFGDGAMRSAHVEKISEELDDKMEQFFALFGAGAGVVWMAYPYICRSGYCKNFKGWWCAGSGTGCPAPYPVFEDDPNYPASAS